MNPNTKMFEREAEGMPDHWMRFGIGDVHELNGVPMRIHDITHREIVLRPVDQEIEQKARDLQSQIDQLAQSGCNPLEPRRIVEQGDSK